MKKLMTMIGAAAAAFGLYADPVALEPSAVGVESDEFYNEGGSVFDDTDGYWFMAEQADDAAVVKAYGEEAKPDHTKAYSDYYMGEPPAQAQYVGLDADAPVFRTFAAVNTELETPAMQQVAIEDATAQRGGIIADQLVKLSAYDTDAEVKLEDGAKIALWLKTLTEGETEEENTYALMATCGALAEETFLPEETTVQLDLGDKVIKPNTWCHLTITAIKALDFKTTAVAGFKVEVDGVVAKVAAGQATLFPEGWDAVATAEAKTLIPNGQLLPSAVRRTDTDNSMFLQGIAFKGTGSVDDITVAQKGLYEIQIEIKAPAGAIIAGVDKGTWNEATKKWTVTPGDEITIALARDGYNIVDPLSVKKTVTGDMTEIDLEGEVDVTPAVAQIVTGTETNLFATLNAAFATAVNNDTIEVVDDVTLSERIFIGSADGDKDITLDLAGKAITWDASVGNASGVLIVRSGSTLTVEDSSGTNAGKIDANGEAYAAIAITHGTYQNNDKTASLIVNGGTLVGFYQGIVGNGNRPNTYVEINDGVITATNTTAEDGNLAIFNPQQNSEVVINGGTLTGLWAAIEMRGGKLTVNGGTLTATAEEYAVKPNGSGSTTMGAAVAVAQHTTKGDVAVEIEGGTLTGTKAVSVANPQGNATDNVAVTLGDATYVGELAFSADGNATVTNNGAQLAAPAGYMWDEDGKLVKIAEPTATVEEITDANHEAAVKFTAKTIGVGYDEWIAKFILKSNVAIGEGEIQLGGQYDAYGSEWLDIDFEGCMPGEAVDVLEAVGYTDPITVDEVFNYIQSFKCGVKNIALKNDATFSLKLVIVNPENEEDVKELCSIDGLEVAKKEESKEIKPGEIATDIEAADEAEALSKVKILPINDEAAAAGQAAVIKGKATQDAVTKLWTVEPVINEAAEEFKAPDLVVETTLEQIVAGTDGEEVTVALPAEKVTPGLYYSIDVATELVGEKAEFVEGARVLATSTGVSLTVTKPEGGKAFFKVSEHMAPTPANVATQD